MTTNQTINGVPLTYEAWAGVAEEDLRLGRVRVNGRQRGHRPRHRPALQRR